MECTRKMGCRCRECSAFMPAASSSLAFRATQELSSRASSSEEGADSPPLVSSRSVSSDSFPTHIAPSSPPKLAAQPEEPGLSHEDAQETATAAPIGPEGQSLPTLMAPESMGSSHPPDAGVPSTDGGHTTLAHAGTDAAVLVESVHHMTLEPKQHSPPGQRTAQSPRLPVNVMASPQERPLRGTGAYNFEAFEGATAKTESFPMMSPMIEKVKARKAAAAARRSLLSPQLRKSMMPSAAAAAAALSAIAESAPMTEGALTLKPKLMHTYAFEELPVGAAANGALSARSTASEEGEASAESNLAAMEAFRTTPLEERLLHKNVNARKSALIDLAKALSNHEPIEASILDVFVAAVKHNNVIEKSLMEASAQVNELGLQLLCAVVNNPSYRALWRGSTGQLLASLLNRTLGINKAQIFTVAVEVVLELIQLDGLTAQTCELVVAGFRNSKNKRVSAGCGKVLSSLVSTNWEELKQHADAIIGSLPGLLQSSDKFQREAALTLCGSLFRHKRESLEAIVGKFPAAIPPEVLASWQAGAPTPVEQPMQPVQAVAAVSDDVDPFINLDLAFAVATAVDLTKEIELLNFSAVMAKEGKAWAEKVSVLEAVSAIYCKTSKVVGDGADIAHCVKRVLTMESNSNVQAAAVQLLSDMAPRLRDKFSLARSLSSTLTDKLRDKKGRIVSSASNALFAFVRFTCMTFDAMAASLQGDVFAPSPSSNGKTPSSEQKTNVLLLLQRLIRDPVCLPDANVRSKDYTQSAKVASLVGWLTSTILETGADTVRYEAEKALGSLLSRTETSGTLWRDIVSIAGPIEELQSKNPAAHYRVLSLTRTPVTEVPAGAIVSFAHTTNKLPRTMSAGATVPLSLSAAPPAAPKRHSAIPASGSSGLKRAPAASKRPASTSEVATHTKSSGDGDDSLDSTTVLEAMELDSATSILEKLRAGVLSIPGLDITSSVSFPGQGGTLEEETVVVPISDILGRLVAGGIKDWPQRKKAIELLGATIELSDIKLLYPCLDSLVVLLSQGLEGNQHLVAQAALAVLNSFTRKVLEPSRMTRRAGALIISSAAVWLKEKSKRTFQQELTQLYVTLAKLLGPNLVVKLLSAYATANPKITAVHERINEVLAILVTTLGVFRMAITPVLVHSMSVAGLSSGSAPVKASAKAMIMDIYAQMGPVLESLLAKKGLVSDAKMLESLRKDFAAASFTPESARQIYAKTEAIVGEALKPSMGPGEAEITLNPVIPADMEDLFEAVDVAYLLPKSIVQDLDTPNTSDAPGAPNSAQPAGGAGAPAAAEQLKPWQQRLAGIEAIIEAIQPTLHTGGVELNDSLIALCKALARRLTDSNTNLRPKALTALALLGHAAGPGIIGCFKPVARAVIEQFSDKRCQRPVTEMLDAWVTDSRRGGVLVQHSFAVILGILANPAEVSIKESMREDLFRWLAKHSVSLTRSSTTLAPLQNQQLYKYVIDALLDKLPMVRQQAFTFVVQCVRIAGTNPLANAINTVSSATSRETLTVQLQQAAELAKSTAPAAGLSELAPTIRSKEESENPAKVSSVMGAPPPPVPPPMKRIASEPAVVASSSTGGKDYNVFVGAPMGKEARLRLASKSRWTLTPDSLTGASGSAFIRSLTNEVQEEWRTACIASKPLFEDLFASGDTAPTRWEGAMLWLNRSLTQAMSPTPSVPSSDAMRALFLNSDLLLKYIAVILLDVREKPSLLSTAIQLLEAFLSACGQHNHVLMRAEADIILPALCEKSGNKREDTRNRFHSLITSFVLLLSANRGPQGFPDGVQGVLEAYIVPACALTKNTSTRVVLLTILAEFVNREGSHRVLKRTAYQTVAKCLSESKSVMEVREAALSLFTAAYQSLKCNTTLFFKMISSDEKGINGKTVAGLDSRGFEMIKARIESVSASISTKPGAIDPTKTFALPPVQSGVRSGVDVAHDLAAIDPFDESIPAPPSGAYEAANLTHEVRIELTQPVPPHDENTSDEGSVSSTHSKGALKGTSALEGPGTTLIQSFGGSIAVVDPVEPIGGKSALSVISTGYQGLDKQLSSDCPQFIRTFFRTLLVQARSHLTILATGAADGLNRISTSSSYKLARCSIEEVAGALAGRAEESLMGKPKIPLEVYNPIARNADAFFAVCRTAIHAAYGGLGYPANRSKHSAVKADEDYAVRILRIVSELMSFVSEEKLALSAEEVEATIRELLSVRTCYLGADAILVLYAGYLQRCFDCRATKGTANVVSGTLLRAIYRLPRGHVVVAIVRLLKPAFTWTPPASGDFKADDAAVGMPASPHEISALVSTLLKTAWTEASIHHVFREVATSNVVQVISEFFDSSVESRRRARCLLYAAQSREGSPASVFHGLGQSSSLRPIPGIHSFDHAAVLRSVADELDLNPSYATYVLSPCYAVAEFFHIMVCFIGTKIHEVIEELGLTDAGLLGEFASAILHQMAEDQHVDPANVRPMPALADDDASAKASRFSQRAERAASTGTATPAGARHRRRDDNLQENTVGATPARSLLAPAVPSTPFPAIVGVEIQQDTSAAIGGAAVAQIEAAAEALTIGSHSAVSGPGKLESTEPDMDITSEVTKLFESIGKVSIAESKALVPLVCELATRTAKHMDNPLDDEVTALVVAKCLELGSSRRQVVWTNMNLHFMRTKIGRDSPLARLVAAHKQCPAALHASEQPAGLAPPLGELLSQESQSNAPVLSKEVRRISGAGVGPHRPRTSGEGVSKKTESP